MVDFHGHVRLPARVVHVDKISDIGSPLVAEKNPDFINWQLQSLFVGIYIYIHIYIQIVYIYIYTYKYRLYIYLCTYTYIYIYVVLCVLL